MERGIVIAKSKCKHEQVETTLLTDEYPVKCGSDFYIFHAVGYMTEVCEQCEEETATALCTNAIIFTPKNGG